MTDDENLDNPEYSHKSDFSKAEVVKLQVQKCNEIRSKEMKEGYFNYDDKGNKVYVPDSRKEWVSAVKALRQLLQPEINRDKKYLEYEKQLIKLEETAIHSFGVYPTKIEQGNIIPIKEARKVIPYLDQPFPVAHTSRKPGEATRKKIEKVPGLYNDNFHQYWDMMVNIYDLLFGELNALIDRCNYFKQEISY